MLSIMKSPKVVILHDWLVGFRGGERVLEAICELFPEAPIYTLIHKKGSTSPVIEARKIHTSFLNEIPGIHLHYRKFLPLFPSAVKAMKIVEPCDLVISVSHCLIKGIEKPSGSKHLCYILSPMRYMYDQYDTYFGPHAPFYQRWGAAVFKNHIVGFDQDSNQSVDQFVSISRFIQERVKKYYGRDSGLVYPFADLKDFNAIQASPPKKEDFFLVLSAFAPNKRVDLAISVCNELKLPLKIIGSGQEELKLKAMAGPTVEFLGNATRAQVIDHLARARGLIFPGVEDFGIVPVESLASGTPLIALRHGGVLETQTNQTAEFFDSESHEGLKAAIHRFLARKFDAKVCYQQAEKFSKDQFVSEFKAAVSQVLG
jgi:glycosyltransferase involved in cell wall biosynthesis